MTCSVSRRAARKAAVLTVFLSIGWVGVVDVRQVCAQDQQPPAQSTPPAQQPDQNAPDAGGPGGDNGVIALPKKKEKEAEPPPPPEPKVKNPPGMGNFSLRVDVPVVTVDAGGFPVVQQNFTFSNV